jgi:hypothetical protein
VSFQLRVEAFNIQNRANFGVPGTVYGTAQFGVISTTAAPAPCKCRQGSASDGTIHPFQRAQVNDLRPEVHAYGNLAVTAFSVPSG